MNLAFHGVVLERFSAVLFLMTKFTGIYSFSLVSVIHGIMIVMNG